MLLLLLLLLLLVVLCGAEVDDGLAAAGHDRILVLVELQRHAVHVSHDERVGVEIALLLWSAVLHLLLLLVGQLVAQVVDNVGAQLIERVARAPRGTARLHELLEGHRVEHARHQRVSVLSSLGLEETSVAAAAARLARVVLCANRCSRRRSVQLLVARVHQAVVAGERRSVEADHRTRIDAHDEEAVAVAGEQLREQAHEHRAHLLVLPRHQVNRFVYEQQQQQQQQQKASF